MTTPIFLAVTAVLAFFAVQWWLRHEHVGDYGDEWPARRAEYWRKHPRVCRVCHGIADALHHIWGVGHWWRGGHEPDRALLPVCTACHDRIHAWADWLDHKAGFTHSLSIRVATWCRLRTGIWRRAWRKVRT